MAVGDLDPATLDVVSPERYQHNGYPHPEWFEVETAEAAAEEYEQMAREQAAGS